MSQRTSIAWTDSTWNPWMGCTKVSPGCAHCYMFAQMRQYGRDPETVVRSKTKFNDPLKWKEPARVFTCSWSDWFHEGADAWRPEAWEIIRRTPHLTYQILTKRPERIAGNLPRDWGREGYPNVWLGVTVESERYDYRAALLCQFPASVRFISAEPLLGRLDLRAVNPYSDPYERRAAWRNDRFLGIDVLEWPRHPPVSYTPGERIGPIDWVIVGGESGPGHRPLDLEALYSVVAQCRYTRTPVFVKQDSGPKPGRRGRIPADLFVQEFPESRAGVLA